MGAVTNLEDYKRVRIDDFFGKTLTGHKSPIQPLTKTVNDPNSNFLIPLEVRAVERDFGNFYESMAQAWYGGSREDNQAIYFSGRTYFTNHRPDLVSDEFEYDQKSLGHNTTLKLRDTQIMMYHQRQALNPHREIRYQLFRHNFRDFKDDADNRCKREELNRGLARNTLYCIDLPLSVMTALWYVNSQGIVNNRFDYGEFDEKTKNMSWQKLNKRLNEDHFTGIKASTLHAFMLEPKLVLKELGLEPKQFTYRKYRSPNRMKVFGDTVRQFPILKVTDKNYDAWLGFLFSKFKPHENMPEELISDADETIANSLDKFARNKVLRKNNPYFGMKTPYPDLAGIVSSLSEVESVEEDIPF